MERVFRPATTILGRLRFAVKFLVVGLVLAVPLGVVAFAYSQEQSSAVDATNTERIGWAAMEPLVRLSQDVVAARHAAVISGNGAAVPAADIEAVDRTQIRYGASLGTAGQWRELRQQLVIAGVTTGHATALAAYDDAFNKFFTRLSADGITRDNTLFVFTADEGDHFVGGAPSPASPRG